DGAHRRHRRLAHFLIERAPLDVLHHDIGAALPHAEIEDRHAMAMLQLADGPCLTIEAGDRLLVLGGALVEELDGHGLAELEPLAPVDHAHAALAQAIDAVPSR